MIRKGQFKAAGARGEDIDGIGPAFLHAGALGIEAISVPFLCSLSVFLDEPFHQLPSLP